jgi:hypothetical protein
MANFINLNGSRVNVAHIVKYQTHSINEVRITLSNGEIIKIYDKNNRNTDQILWWIDQQINK